jgi:hypothetical protein
MTASDKKSLPAIGFLTVVEHADGSLYGGYLVLNINGRPLEFHCTAPVKPNRAQEILYGPTLKPFLHGEQIGQTLIEKARVEPLFVCTDIEPALAAREFISWPLVLLLDEAAAASVGERLHRFVLGRNHAVVSFDRRDDEELVVARWAPQSQSTDLMEPFSRIRDAIEEAQRSARPAA